MAGSMTGMTLNNRYQLIERVGIGGMAEVYRAHDTVLDRVVAVKVMLPQYAADQTFQARFRQEAASAAKLQSPYIVSIYDWGLDAESDKLLRSAHRWRKRSKSPMKAASSIAISNRRTS